MKLGLHRTKASDITDLLSSSQTLILTNAKIILEIL